jgi:hypothetical protein
MAVCIHDADRTPGALHRTGYLYPFFLEESLNYRKPGNQGIFRTAIEIVLIYII